MKTFRNCTKNEISIIETALLPDILSYKLHKVVPLLSCMASAAILQEDQIPSQWYNIQADMKTKPAPMLDPSTKEPVSV